jgi:phosphoribosylglycinamide formyltransferase-1
MGYMLVVRGDLLEQYSGKIINTHPGVLPKTADTMGIGASQKVLDLGLEASAHTVHLVDEGIDTGRILCSTPVDVEPGETSERLFEKIQIVEKAVLPLVIDRFLKEQAA